MNWSIITVVGILVITLFALWGPVILSDSRGNVPDWFAGFQMLILYSLAIVVFVAFAFGLWHGFLYITGEVGSAWRGP